ncbi:NADH-quinone oxidoreductase subunit L [Basilea psittacipulmonis]|uniref:NADH:ubiquinone oxidoreductase subunit L n=1 Tax=Basilea psittacipulmonis DSM 24701 TaxID=1072685 RepID=A0A077DJB3_9BURK|nr:NADH-quinone oxidoreductase subunit L [Basilea psittacipulmonis]AIL33193.1 NADH:ubiquinone oxidoreductase subunit L [Basilea psittacipulmonis DSM 24701]
MTQTFSATFLLLIALAPLFGAMAAGLFGTGFFSRCVSRKGAQSITIALVAFSFFSSAWVLYQVLANDYSFNQSLYTWSLLGNKVFEVGFMIDSLSATMMVVVTSVSLMVHVYTIGYMADDPGYQRFFAYISLFTFAMLMLIMGNNMMQLFFGWEGVGLVSYLLIGFWYTKPTAIFANLKAFLVNRVGDFGFVLGIGLIFAHAGSMNYTEIFAQAETLSEQTVTGTGWPLLTAACFCLFVGAMAKSAQVPLHSWLPDSMEGPTPISALIHAATMVTAGIFMVSRFSPLFELAPTVLSIITVIGAIGALFLGLLGIIQNDIKRVIAYSTLSQLGYMTVALGVSAYPVAVFHLMTHAFFKALLFLGAGSVIIGMHHDQDIRHMGGLRKYMPITWITFLIGTLALVGTPFFSGFYSKEQIIEAAAESHIWGHTFAYYATLCGVFVTSLYSFRLYFLVFHGKERYDQAEHHGHHGGKPHESPWVVTLPLVLLAIPSIIIGAIAVDYMLFGSYFARTITIHENHEVMSELAQAWHGWVAYGLHAFTSVPFWLMIAGLVVAWYAYLINPALPPKIYRALVPINSILENKYFVDWVNEQVVARFSRALGRFFWLKGDKGVIDGYLIGGATRLVAGLAWMSRILQTGRIYHYAFAMIVGVIVLISVFVLMN